MPQNHLDHTGFVWDIVERPPRAPNPVKISRCYITMTLLKPVSYQYRAVLAPRYHLERWREVGIQLERSMCVEGRCLVSFDGLAGVRSHSRVRGHVHMALRRSLSHLSAFV